MALFPGESKAPDFYSKLPELSGRIMLSSLTGWSSIRELVTFRPNVGSISSSFFGGECKSLELLARTSPNALGFLVNYGSS